MTIDLGFAYATLPDGTELGFVDVPGHERFLPNMLAGVLGIDRVLLVVAADDGPRPQTIEHLDILDLIGVAELTGIVTKIDRVAPERRDAVVADTRALLAEAGFADSPIFPVSSLNGVGIAALTEHLGASAASAADARAAARPSGLFRLPIDRTFTLPGIGLVVTGTVATGTVTVGERLMLSPQGIECRVRGLHAQNRPVAAAGAGERCALNLAGSFPDGGGPGRGDWILDAERHAPVRRLDVELRASRFADGLRSGLPVHLHLGTADVVARVAVLDARTLMPGEIGFVQLDLDHPIGALHGDRAVLRDHAARHTLAGGRVIDPFPPRRGRARPERLIALARNRAGDEVAALAAGGDCEWVGPPHARIAITRDRLATLGEALIETLAAAHRAQPATIGPIRATLVAKCRAMAPEAALDAALATLAETGRVVREGGMWRLAEHRPRLTQADEKLWQRLCPLIAAGALRPPRVRELAETLALDPVAVERLLVRAEHLGRVVRVADNRFFLPETIAQLTAIAAGLADASSAGSFTAAAFKDKSGVGRNLTIEILEYLDRIGLTRRVGDARVVLAAAEAPPQPIQD
jgi:selenocysteine-specific elongation factor